MLGGVEYFLINQIGETSASPEQISAARTVAIVVFACFIAISAAIIIFASRTIISPISKLIKNAKKIAEGEGIEKFIRSSRNRGCCRNRRNFH